ncbi:Ail/Lom family outer membrane beta-barrel protein [Proteus mirabilis]|uniref:Ail/Lom family outer membrane beta-barrel protein n=1 Tax=Proteus mirabilis TaxID=584 RepID=UPI0018C5473C|nr:Ail/Lom family outer membrane beta-barrel protein [Proteus mirabilis]MBG6015350.1 Ail/Lom family outer membrane beta-barrel protein [Proteus mirabilis]MDX4950474.1 Ail/Lom family outer membrane beta-barrel protein [Proteus mirabilis]
MKKQLLSALFISGIFSISTVQAHENTSLDKTTISAGYAQIKIAGQSGIMRGGNLSIRQELNQQLGLMAIATYAQNEYNLNKPIKQLLKDVDARYYSVMAGPTLRLNDYISIYGVAGMAQIEFKGLDTRQIPESILKKHAFSWGTGVTINPIDMLSVSVGYENSRYKMNKLSDNKLIIDGFIANIGYSF